MKTEYLITFDSSDSICTDVERFKHLLTTHEAITFSKTKPTISFNGIEFPYTLATGRLTDASYYYDFTVEDNNSSPHASCSSLLKAIRGLCTKFSGRNVIILHDGIGEFYCQQGYPIIYKTENLMRKLISKFMAISLGYDWRESSTPKEVLDSVRGDGKNEKTNFLLEVDFIQLSTFLFKKYTKSDSSRFIDSLKEKNSEDTIKVGELKHYVAFTNWEKYFSIKVNCESEYLKSKWDRLYALRCKIAHCKGLSKLEFEELVELSDDIGSKIQTALDSINDIHIEEEEREELAENLSGAANQNAAEFIIKYNKMASLVQQTCELVSDETDIYNKHDTNKKNIRMQTSYLCNTKGLIEKNEVDLINALQLFRNKIVHQSGIVEVSSSELTGYIDSADNISNTLLALDPEKVQLLKGKNIRQGHNQETLV